MAALTPYQSRGCHKDSSSRATPVNIDAGGASRYDDATGAFVMSHHYPDLESFRRLARGADLIPVFRRLTSDTLTAVTAFHKIDRGQCACLFESVIGGERVGRYSFFAGDPFFLVEAPGREVTISSHEGVERFAG